jgi:hypothetical protein
METSMSQDETTVGEEIAPNSNVIRHLPTKTARKENTPAQQDRMAMPGAFERLEEAVIAIEAVTHAK